MRRTRQNEACLACLLPLADRRDFHPIANIWRDRLAHGRNAGSLSKSSTPRNYEWHQLHSVFQSSDGRKLLAYDYQSRLALGEADSRNTGTACHSQLIIIPTGLGKTAAVILAWLWNRVLLPSLNSQPSTLNQPWPRRLVHCLPMRTLVEQTAGEVKKWIDTIVADEKGELALGDETTVPSHSSKPSSAPQSVPNRSS